MAKNTPITKPDIPGIEDRSVAAVVNLSALMRSADPTTAEAVISFAEGLAYGYQLATKHAAGNTAAG